MGCLPAEGLSGTPVELFADSLEIVDGVEAEVGALREVVTEQAVGVPYCGRARIGDVVGSRPARRLRVWLVSVCRPRGRLNEIGRPVSRNGLTTD